jgi:hypothetical protein
MMAYIDAQSDIDNDSPKARAQAILLWNAHGLDGLNEHIMASLLASECHLPNKCGTYVTDYAKAGKVRPVQRELMRIFRHVRGNLNPAVVPAKPPQELLDWAKQTLGGCAVGQSGPSLTDSVPELRPLAQCERWVTAFQYNGTDQTNRGYRNFMLRWNRDSSTLARRQVCNTASDYVVQYADGQVAQMEHNSAIREKKRMSAEAERLAAEQRARAGQNSDDGYAAPDTTVRDTLADWDAAAKAMQDCVAKYGACSFKDD